LGQKYVAIDPGYVSVFWRLPCLTADVGRRAMRMVTIGIAR
jgi:hypothetical protein